MGLLTSWKVRDLVRQAHVSGFVAFVSHLEDARHTMEDTFASSHRKTTNLRHGPSCARERGGVLTGFDDNLRLEHESDTKVAFVTVFRRGETKRLFSGLERFELSKINLRGTETLCLFKLIPVKQLYVEVGSYTRRLQNSR